VHVRSTQSFVTSTASVRENDASRLDRGDNVVRLLELWLILPRL